MAPGGAVLAYHLRCYRRTWRGSVFASFATPLLLLVGIGAAVGAHVSGGVDGLPYLQFFGTGLVAFVGVQVAVLESTGPVMGKLSFRIYHSMAAAPLRVGDLVAGQLGYIGLRIGVAATAVLVVMVPLGAAPRLPQAAATPLVAVLVGLAVAGPVLAYAASIDNVSLLVATLRLGLLPMTFLSGVFFPVEELPMGLAAVAHLLPLWHGVELCRAAAVGATTSWPVPAHVGYLGLWAAAGFWLATVRFRRRLLA